MRAKGRLTQWDDAKGFGFITPLAGGERLFIHVSAFARGAQRPAPGQVITYTVGSDAQGRPCAINARSSVDLLKPRRRRPGTLHTRLAVIFLALVALLVVAGRIPVLLLAGYVLVSTLTYLVYWRDKRASRLDVQRTPEKTLHLLSLLGGWPGALIAQQRLRHKSSKAAFRAIFWPTVVLNCAVLLWLLTPAGAAFLQSLPDYLL